MEYEIEAQKTFLNLISRKFRMYAMK